MDQTELFICTCNDVQHQFVVHKLDDEIYIEVLLNPERNFFKRIWIAIKYIFGHKSIYGYFDEIIVKPKDIDRLCKILRSGLTEHIVVPENKWESE